MKNFNSGLNIVTVKAAAKEICSGDTVWVGSADSISQEFLNTLAERQSELENVTILAEKGSCSCKILDELKYKSSFHVISFFTEALVQTYQSGNKVEFFKFTAPKTIEAVCRQFDVNAIAVAVCPPGENGNCNVGKSGNFLTPIINSYPGIKKRIAIIDKNLPVGNGSESLLPLSSFDFVCEPEKCKSSKKSDCNCA